MPRRTRWFDRDGNPVPMEMAVRKLGDPTYQQVAFTTEPNWELSTVWLGLDHQHTPNGPPLIFESMVFPADGSGGLMLDRYPTYAAALAGHDQWVAHLKDKGIPHYDT